MDNLTLRFKNARALIYARLCCKGCDYDGLQDLTGLADDQLDLVLKNMQDSREVCTVNRGGDVEYRLISLDKRVHSWELRRYNPDRVLAIDVETTGLDRSKDDVLQLAIVEYDEDVRVNSFYGSSKLEWPAATQINSITPDMVNGLIRLCECPDFVTDQLSDAAVIMGYNLIFDQNMLRAAGVKIPSSVLCCDVMYDVRDMLHNMPLARACDLFKVPAAPAHDAVNDCMNTIKLARAVSKVIL